jgi:hypothetical protein
MTFVAGITGGALTLWVVVRNVLLATKRRRRVVIVPGAGAMLLVGLGLLAAAPIGGGEARPAVVAVAAVLATAVVVRDIWVVVPASPDEVLAKAELVTRGLRLTADRNGRSIVATGGFGAFVVAAAARRAVLLRVPTDRSAPKSLLFARGLEKFLGPKEGGRT